MKKVFFLVFFYCLFLNAAEIDSVKSSGKAGTESVRSLYFTFGVLGIPDAISSNLGVQFHKNIS